MKIGVDARLLSRRLTGIGRYTLEMCRALLKLENITLYLYSPGIIVDKVREQLPSAQIREMSWNNNFLRQLWSQSYLPLWARSDGVDVFWGPAHRLPRFLPKNIPQVVTIHDLVWKYASKTMSSATYVLERIEMPFAVRSADIVVADSCSTAEQVKSEFRVEDDKMSVIPLAANYDRNVLPFNVLETLGIYVPYFLFVGTLEPRKNLTRLLAAYALLPEKVRDNSNLVIAGGKGWGDLDIKDEISRLSLREHVRVLGYVDEALLNTLYSYAEFLAIPSLYEGFCLPLVEAMIHGKPVLTSNNSSMPEVAGDAGLLVEAQDIHSIKWGLSQLITDRRLYTDLAENALRQAKRFSWDNSAQKIVVAFERAVSVRKSRHL
jgi:glycosyltransferase involved in cell wall biosynthesis